MLAVKEDSNLKEMNQAKYTVVSLFAGCGGLDLGLEGGFEYLGNFYEHNKFKTIWANEINTRASQTFKLNFPDAEVVCNDVTEILCGNYVLPDADLVCGGFPCQDFSLAGKRQGLTVNRGKLYLSMAKVIEEIKPKMFLAENVKGLLTWEKGLAIRTIVNDFSNLGYHVEYKLLNAANFGVPQTRERVIIVGIRNDILKNQSIEWVRESHSGKSHAVNLFSEETMLPWVTLKEAIGDLEDDLVHESLPNHAYSKAKCIPNTQGNTKTKADKPGPTMRAEHHGNIEYHYSLPRRLSAREAARIQSFPDNFKFLNSTTDAYRQIGNAIAPVFGWHLARMLEQNLDRLTGWTKEGID